MGNYRISEKPIMKTVLEDLQLSERMKLDSLRTAIAEAREQYAQGLGEPFDQSAVNSIKSEGRQILAERNNSS